MAIQEHGGSSGDGAYLPPSPEKKPKGRTILAGELPTEVERELRPHHSNWLILEKSVAQDLRESEGYKFFALDGKHWTDNVRDAREASRFNEWYAFEKKPTPKTSGGGAAKNNNSTYITPSVGLDSFLNLDPTVRIANPLSEALLKLNNNTQFKNNLVQHTFVEGDTVTRVAKQYSGSDDPEAIYNFNNPSFTQKRPPQTGDTVRVLAGRELKVDGSVQNSASVTLSWQGPTSGTQTLDNTKGGKNETVSWEATIPAKAGDYHLTANASGATSNTVTLKVIDPNAHWVKFKLLDEDGKPVEQALDYVVRFDDGTEIRSQLKDGLDYLTGVPLLPFTIEIIPGKTLNEKLATLRETLRTELATSMAQVKADTARHEKDWAKIGNVEAGFIYLGSGLTGAGEWVVDTVKGVTELATGIVNANIATYAWTGKYIGHRVDAFASYASGDTEGLKQSTQNIEALHKELGEDVSEIGDHAETLALLAWDDDTRNMLTDFPRDYFSELSGVERTRAVTRYGIDFLLIFVGGLGAGALAIKNSGRISKLLKEMLELIKQLRFQQTVKKPKVDETYPFGPVKKPSSAGSSLAKEKGLSDPPEGYHWADVNGKPALRKNPGTLGPQKKYNAEKDEFVDVPKKKSQDKTDTGKKGLIGEQKADEYMSKKGYTKIGGRGNKPQGIDGVYENSKPPPKFVVAEAKYGNSGYSTTKDGTKQMSEDWVEYRLADAVGDTKADEIMMDGYKRAELRYDPVTDTVKQRDIPW